jgi:hypothetical protein
MHEERPQGTRASATAGVNRPESKTQYPATTGHFSIRACVGRSCVGRSTYLCDATCTVAVAPGFARLVSWPIHPLPRSRRTLCACETRSIGARHWPCCKRACVSRTRVSTPCATCCRPPWRRMCGPVRSTPRAGHCWLPTPQLPPSCASCSRAWSPRCWTRAGRPAPSESRFKRVEAGPTQILWSVASRPLSRPTTARRAEPAQRSACRSARPNPQVLHRKLRRRHRKMPPMVPAVRIERTTFRLQGGCSTN